jgi:hypothetical protein
MRKAGILIVIPMLVLLVPLFWIIGTATSIAIQEGLAMKTTILVIIVMLGLMIPLMWFIGTLISMVYFYLHRVKATSEERSVAFNPQLGLTMADGGDSIDKEKKE